MRIREVITEAIQNAPRNIAIFIQLRIKALTEFDRRAKELQALIKKADPAWRDFEYSASRVMLDDPEASDAFWYIETFIRRINSDTYAFASMQNVAEWILRSEGESRKWLNLFIESVERNYEQYRSAEIVKVFPYVDQIIEKHVENGYLNPEYMEPDELAAHKAAVEVLKKTAEMIKLWEQFYNETVPKLKEWLRKTHLYGDEKDRRPAHGDVETLYHASAFAAEIEKDGFHESKPDDRLGLGTISTTEISFTHDIHIAKELRRCLIEMVMIANGELKFRQILDWCQREKIFDQFKGTPGMDSLSAILHINASVRDPKNPDIEDTASLYNWYLWMNKIKRPNPVFMSPKTLVTKLVGRSPKDVGILECQVRLTGKERYQDAESEFLVPPGQIETIKRII